MPGEQLLNEPHGLLPFSVFEAASDVKVKMGKMPHEDTSETGVCPLQAPGMATTPITPGSRERGLHQLLPRLLEKTNPAHTWVLDSDSRTVRKQIPVVLSLPIGGSPRKLMQFSTQPKSRPSPPCVLTNSETSSQLFLRDFFPPGCLSQKAGL